MDMLLHAMELHLAPSLPRSLTCFHQSLGQSLPEQKSVLSGAGFDSPLVLPTAFLTPPGMEVTKDGFYLVIKLEDLGPQFEFLVAYWKREPGTKVRLLALAFDSDFGEGVRPVRGG